MNPRGAVTDGSNHFWSCGNASGTAYYDANGSGAPVTFAARAGLAPGQNYQGHAVHDFEWAGRRFSRRAFGDFFICGRQRRPGRLPESPKTRLSLVVQADKDYSKIAGFDMNPEGTIAYTADAEKGIQKYVKADGQWKFAYNFSIPQNISAAANHESGCFALTVDFSPSAPIIYATTTEGYNGSVNSNRVVRVEDTGVSAPVTTIAQAASPEIAFRGIAFTPEAK